MQPFSLPIYSAANKSQVLRTPVFKNFKQKIKVQKNFLNENKNNSGIFKHLFSINSKVYAFTRIL